MAGEFSKYRLGGSRWWCGAPKLDAQLLTRCFLAKLARCSRPYRCTRKHTDSPDLPAQYSTSSLSGNSSAGAVALSRDEQGGVVAVLSSNSGGEFGEGELPFELAYRPY
jgi:hypothetical protein